MNNDSFKSSEKFSDDKYKIYDIVNDKHKLRRIICDSEAICLIPFDTNSENKVKNIYLARFIDYLNNNTGHTCISLDCKKEGYDSQFDEISDIIKNELNIEVDVNDIFYLGKINHNLPFTKSYKCYGLNLDNYSKDLNGFSLDISDDEKKTKLYSLDKVKFNRVLNGDIDDSLCMSAALLLMSYIN